MKHASPNEFICDMIDNEGDVFRDGYGRCWMYLNYRFMFKDIGECEWNEGLSCLHLFGSEIRKRD